MNTAPETDRPHKIVILNPKGGSGKTTLATNIAASFAAQGPPPTLIDCDPQGFCLRWLERRPPARPRIHGVSADGRIDSGSLNARAGNWPESRQVIVDLPAAVEPAHVYDLTYDADSILIPVMPSSIDTYAASRFVAELLLQAQIDRRNRQLAIVANRVRRQTRAYRKLRRFLGSLRIPVIGELRDSQNFVAAAAEGLGVAELAPSRAKIDAEAFGEIRRWLDDWQMRRLDAAATSRFEHRPGIPVLTPITRLPRTRGKTPS